MAKRKKGQKDKQRSTKHTHKTKDRVTRTPLKTGGELGCSGRVGSSCSTSGIRNDNFCLLYLWLPSSWDHQIPIILFIRDLNVDTCTPLKCPGGFCFVALLCWYFWLSLFNLCSIYQFIILEPQTTMDTAPATTCTPVLCELFCPHGFALDAVSGCPRCGCNDAPTE